MLEREMDNKSVAIADKKQCLMREIPYSKGLLGRLRNTFNKCELRIIGGEEDGRIAGARQFMGFLPPLFTDKDLQPYEYAKVTMGFEQAIAAMLQVRREFYLGGIGGEDLSNLPSIALALSPSTDLESNTAIRVVYGATEEMPLRALSYMLPALVYIENMATANIHLPQLQVIFTNRIASQLNGLDIDKTAEQVRTFSQFAKRFVKEFFPGSAQKVVFLEDAPLTKGSVIRDELIYIAQLLEKYIPPDIKDLLAQKGNNGRGHINIFYGAAHTLIHDIDLPESLVPLFDDQGIVDSVDNIISFGGFREQFFYRLRQVVKPFLDEKYRKAKTLQFFTKHRVPPYYMAKGGDISLDDVLVRKSFYTLDIAEMAQDDLDYMREVSNYRGDFKNFLEKERKKLSEK